jgi:hypothetical protein
MLTESFVLVVLVVLMSYLTLRSGKRGVALILLPLVVVPLTNLLASGLAPQLDKLSEAMSANHWRVLLVMAALAVTMGLVGGISRNIKKKGPRRTYMLLCGGFSLIFSFMIIRAVLPNL